MNVPREVPPSEARPQPQLEATMPEPITPKISKAICSFDACDRPCCARGLCASHDLQRRRGRTLTPLRPSRLTPKIHKATCSFDACGRSSQAKGLCSSHHAQRMRGRTLTQLRPLRWANTPLMPYLWSRIDKNGPVPEYAPELGPCWLWLGGQIHLQQKTVARASPYL